MAKSNLLLFSPILVYIVLVVSVFFFAKDVSAVSGLLNILVAIGGLLVAILTTIMNYWTRLDAQRQTLYEKQIEAYNEIYPVALKTSSELLHLVSGNAASHNRLEQTRHLENQFHEVTRKHWLLFPKEVRDLVISFEHDLWLFEKELVSDPPNDDNLKEIVVNNPDKLGLLIDAFRTSLGIEKLHENTLLLMGERVEHKSEKRKAA